MDLSRLEPIGLALVGLATLLHAAQFMLDLGHPALRVAIIVLLIAGLIPIALILKSEGKPARPVPLVALILVAVQLSILVGDPPLRRRARRWSSTAPTSYVHAAGLHRS